jgi:hypothetical protein
VGTSGIGGGQAGGQALLLQAKAVQSRLGSGYFLSDPPPVGRRNVEVSVGQWRLGDEHPYLTVTEDGVLRFQALLQAGQLGSSTGDLAD